MKIKNRFVPIYSMADDGDGEGAGGGGGGTTFTQAQLDEAVNNAVSGLKTKNTELLDSIKGLKSGLKAWEGLDPDNVRGMLAKFENDEVLKLHAEGKHDEAYNKRMEKERAQHQSAIDTATTELNDWKSKAEKAELQVRDLIIDQQVLTNFMSEKGLESAAPDVVLRAKAAFKIEDGVAIARDDRGEIIRGKEGPITVKEWVQSLKETAPHLFPGSQGAGASGAGAGGGSGDLEAQMAAAADRGDMETYRKLRKKQLAAGNE